MLRRTIFVLSKSYCLF